VAVVAAVAAAVAAAAVVLVAYRNHLEGAWRRLSRDGEAFSIGGWRM
jgi:hypothetical protein